MLDIKTSGPSLEEEIDVELGQASASAAAVTADRLGGELEDVEAGLTDVRVVADDVPEVPVPQVLQLAVCREIPVKFS